jgi:hypothetical protein
LKDVERSSTRRRAAAPAFGAARTPSRSAIAAARARSSFGATSTPLTPSSINLEWRRARTDDR